MFFEITQDTRVKPYASWVDVSDNLRHEPSLVNFIAAYERHPSVAGPDNIVGNADDPVQTYEMRRAAACAIVGALTSDPAGYCVENGFATPGLVDNGNSMIDGSTGLEWLDLMETAGLSYNAVEASTLYTVEGYRHATSDEVRTLFLNAGFPTVFASSSPGNNPAGTDLLNFLGCTDGFCAGGDDARGRGRGFVSTGPNANRAYRPTYFWFNAGSGNALNLASAHKTATFPQTPNAGTGGTGHFLVRATSAPPADALDFLYSRGAWSSDADGRASTGLEDIDFWNGGLAEERMPFGGFLGSTHNFAFELQLEALQNGDRFYFVARTANIHFLSELESNSFTALARRNTDMGEVGGGSLSINIFSLPNHVLEVDQDEQFDAAGDGTTADPEGDSELTPLVIRDALDVTSNIHILDATRFIQYTGGDHVTIGGTTDSDTIIGGIGDDTILGGDGNDRLEGGDGADLIEGGAGDDWMENKGGGEDLWQGDDGVAAEAGESPVKGNDVAIAHGGNNDFDMESGDDIIVDGPGIDRAEGQLGFDWMSFQNDQFGVNIDLDLTVFLRPQLPPSNNTVLNRYDRVEAVSGSPRSDVLRGTPNPPAESRGNELVNFALIEGLNDSAPGADDGLVPLTERFELEPDVITGEPQFGWTGGEIIIGGAGSDLIVGEGGNDIIDGDAALTVMISTPDPAVRSGPLGQALRSARALAASTASQAAADDHASTFAGETLAAANAAVSAANALVASTQAEAQAASDALRNTISIRDALGNLITASVEGSTTVGDEWRAFLASCSAVLVDIWAWICRRRLRIRRLRLWPLRRKRSQPRRPRQRRISTRPPWRRLRLQLQHRLTW